MMPEEYFHMGFHGMILGAGAYVEYEGKVIHRELMTKQEVQTVIDWGKSRRSESFWKVNSMDIMIQTTMMTIMLQ